MVELLLLDDSWSERLKMQIKAMVPGTDQGHRKSINAPYVCKVSYEKKSSVYVEASTVAEKAAGRKTGGCWPQKNPEPEESFSWNPFL